MCTWLDARSTELAYTGHRGHTCSPGVLAGAADLKMVPLSQQARSGQRCHTCFMQPSYANTSWSAILFSCPPPPALLCLACRRQRGSSAEGSCTICTISGRRVPISTEVMLKRNCRGQIDQGGGEDWCKGLEGDYGQNSGVAWRESPAGWWAGCSNAAEEQVNETV